MILNKYMKFILITSLMVFLIIIVLVLPNKEIKKKFDTDSNYLIKNEISNVEAEFLYGTWNIEKLIGFTDIQSSRCNYPYGQDIIDNILIIEECIFSSMDLTYDSGVYQRKIKNPYYIITNTNEEINNMGSYWYFGMNPQEIGIDLEVDILKVIEIEENTSLYGSVSGGMPGELIIVNYERLIYYVDSAYFELKKLE